MKAKVVLFLLLILSSATMAQDRYVAIDQMLRKLAADQPGLEGSVELNVSGISVQELVRGIAETHGLNVAIDGTINQTVVNNFANAKVRDVLVFLCKKYDMEIEIIGSIISLKKYTAPPVVSQPYQRKKSDVVYDPKTDFLSLNLRDDTLDFVAQDITMNSAYNIVLSPKAKGKLVSVYIQNRPFADVLDKLSYANGLTIKKTGDNFFLIDVDEESNPSANTTNRNRNIKQSGQPGAEGNGNFEYSISSDLITLSASDASIADIIEAVSMDTKHSYFMYNVPTEKTTCLIENATYEGFLNYILHGTKYTFKQDNAVYLIGDRTLEGLRSTELIQMQFRTIESVLPSIPDDLKQGLKIIEFKDLNGIIVSGAYLQIHELKAFLQKIDQVVPMVNIEVMIVDVQKSDLIDTGVSMGLGEQPVDGGTLAPGVDMNFSSTIVNNLINAFNGFGLINLGPVSPDFYVSIRALQSHGVIKINSTPMLATLNGHEATMSIGATEYYAEVQTNTIGSNNVTTVSNQIYKPTTADLKITITPFVSNDEQVTLEIEVQQADFTGRIAASAPPGSVQRNFKSVVRVKNGEMIMLGGLDKESYNDTTEGVPILSRIPIIKWFVSNKKKEQADTKLNIFIRPTIIY
jgi:type IV pilus assembly protein PilQ